MTQWDHSIPSIPEKFYARAIGKVMLDYAKDYDIHESVRKMESGAMELVEQIRTILNDDTLADPECFCRVEALVNAFIDAGLYTTRHEELE